MFHVDENAAVTLVSLALLITRFIIEYLPSFAALSVTAVLM